jgi:hypothetical protein
MDSSANFFQILRSLVEQIPSILAMLGCTVAAIVSWKRHSRVSLTVIIAMVLLLIHAFVFPFVHALVPVMVMRSTGSFERVQTVRSVISFLYNSTLAVGLGVLLVAVFMQRNRPSTFQTPDS